MFNPSLDIEVENWEVDQKGRQIILRARIDDAMFIFINVYAPNDLKKQLSWKFSKPEKEAFENTQRRQRRWTSHWAKETNNSFHQ